MNIYLGATMGRLKPSHLIGHQLNKEIIYKKNWSIDNVVLWVLVRGVLTFPDNCVFLSYVAVITLLQLWQNMW